LGEALRAEAQVRERCSALLCAAARSQRWLFIHSSLASIQIDGEMAHSLLYLPEGRAMLQHSWQVCRVDEQNQALPLLP
jgi:hypothetical protein